MNAEPSRGHARRRPPGTGWGAVVLGLVALLGAAACSTHTPASKTAPSTTAPAGSDLPTTVPVLKPGQVDHKVGVTFQYKSFRITVGHAVYDANLKQLSVGLHFTNLSGSWGQSEIAGNLEAGGTTVPFSGQPFDVPPGASIDATGVAYNVPGDPARNGRIVWGSSSYDQPVIGLDGHSSTNLWLPTVVKADGWAHIGRYGVHLTGVQVNASQTEQGLQADPHKRILRVFVDAFTARGTTNPFTAASNLLLKLPGGATVDAVDGSSPASQLSWTQKGGNWADFPVPANLKGHYEVLLASMAKVAFGTIRPQLIVRRPIGFDIGDLKPSPPPTVALPYPDLSTAGTTGTGKAFDEPLSVGSMNVPGFDVRPTRLRYDPGAATATLDAVVTYLQTQSGATGGVLSASPTFGFPTVLTSGGHLYTGTVQGGGTVDAKKPTAVTIQYLSVTSLDRRDAAIYLGPHSGVTSSLPLGSASSVPAYPTPPVAGTIAAPAAAAGEWTVKLRSYRVGLLNASLFPPVGMRDLEVSLDVTASPSSKVRALGLSFSPQYQLLLAGDSGYDIGAVADSGLVELKPGQTTRLTATFEVPETFTAGRVPFVIRSRSEIGDIAQSYIETRFLATLSSTGGSGATAGAGSGAEFP